MGRIKLLLLSISILMSSWASAQTFTVGVEDIDYYPLYIYKSGKYDGAAKDILDKFAASKGYTFEYKPYPVVRLTKYFVEGQLDFKFPDNEHWAGDAKKGLDLKYSGEVLGFTDGVMVAPSSKGKGIANLKSLGIVRGFTPWDYMSHIESGAVKTKETTSLEGLIKQAIHGRVDGAYFNVSVAQHHLKDNLKTPDALVFDESLPHTASSYKLSSFNQPKIIEEFNQFLVDEAAAITEIKKSYGLE